MNALARNAQTPDDTRIWSPSLVEALPTRIPPLDPVAQLLAEERHECAWLRLVLSALATSGQGRSTILAAAKAIAAVARLDDWLGRPEGPLDRIAAGLLLGKRTAVTGAGSGIGRAIALRFAREGALVAAMGRTQASLDALATFEAST